MGIMRHTEITKLALDHTLVCVLGSTLRHLASAFLHYASLCQLQCQRPAPTHAASSSWPCLLVSRLLGSARHQSVLWDIATSIELYCLPQLHFSPWACLLIRWKLQAPEICLSQSLGVPCTKNVLRCVHSWASWWRVSSFPQVSVT